MSVNVENNIFRDFINEQGVVDNDKDDLIDDLIQIAQAAVVPNHVQHGEAPNSIPNPNSPNPNAPNPINHANSLFLGDMVAMNDNAPQNQPQPLEPAEENSNNDATDQIVDHEFDTFADAYVR